MANPTTVPGDLIVPGDLRLSGSLSPLLSKSSVLAQTDLAIFDIPWTSWRVWNALQTNLPGTAASDDLALVGGTFGTASPSIQTLDFKTTTTTAYARCQIALPWNYVTANTVQLNFHAGMTTTIADDTCILDVNCYETDEEVGLVGAPTDICATAAQSINSLTFADITFTITATNLVAGDLLDIRVEITGADIATGTAVIGTIGAAQLLCDVR